MMPYSKNSAYHVLRLVFRAQTDHRRRYATAAATGELQMSSAAEEHESAVGAEGLSSPEPASFLESDGLEYRAVTLPVRPAKPLSIPWPTIFPHKHTNHPSQSAAADRVRPQRQCDVLAHFIEISDLVSARRVLTELESHGVAIHHRPIYLHAALLTLNSKGDKAMRKREFLKWMTLYPNRPANQYSDVAAQTWMPVTSMLIQRFTYDHEFLSDFLVLGASKGLLPPLMPTIFSHIVNMVSPKESLALLENVLQIYRKYTTSLERQSTSARASRFDRLVSKQMQSYRGKHIHYLARAGWKEEAQAIYRARQGWDEHTTAYLADLFQQKKAAQPDPSPLTNPSSTLELSIPQQIRAALHNPRVTPAELANTLQHLHDRPSLLARFEQRFTHPVNQRYRYRGNIWQHALLLSYARVREHHKAVQVFSDYFLWVGLPAQAGGAPSGSKVNKRKKSPSIHVITSVLPSVLATLPNTSVGEYSKAYKNLLPTLPPALRPAPLSSLALTKATLQSRETSAIEPTGTPALSAMLCRLAGDHDWNTAQALLDAMEQHGPEPNLRTYSGLMAVLLKVGLKDPAHEVLQRMQTRFGDQESREFLLKLKDQFKNAGS